MRWSVAVWRLLWLISGCWLTSQPGSAVLLAQTLPKPEPLTNRQGLPQAFVPAIVQDSRGFIWMATRDGLARYDGSRFKVFRPDPDGQPSLSSADVTQLKLDHHGMLWISNERGDLDRFDPVTERFTNLSGKPAFKGLRINRICIDRQDQLWIAASDDGLIRFNLRTNQGQHYRHRPDQPQSLIHNSVIEVAAAPDGTIWALTTVGLDCIDPKKRTIRHYLNQANLKTVPKGLWVRPSGDVLVTTDRWLHVVRPTSGQIHKYPLPAPVHPVSYAHFAEDRQGHVYFARHTELFSFMEGQGVRPLDSGNNQSQQVYLSAFVDRSNVLWLGSAGAGVRKYDLRNQPFQTAAYQVDFVHDLFSRGWLHRSIRSLPPAINGLSSYNFRHTLDGQGRLWYNAGSSDMYRLDWLTQQSELIPFPIRFRNPYVGGMPCPMATDPTGRVWAVYDSTAYWYDQPRSRWIRFPFRIPRQPDTIVQMLVVDEQALWLATSTGGLLRINRGNGQSRTYSHIRGQSASLTSNALLCLATDPDNHDVLWIGTFGSGLCRFDKKTGQVKRLSLADGLPNNVIYSVLPDQHGDLWVGTNKGISRINRRTLRVQTYTTDDGILADEFNRFHFIYLPGPKRRSDGTTDDRVLMGGLEGITAFYPRQIKPDRFRPVVEMTDLYINNQPALPGPRSPLGDLPIQAVDELTLPYHQNFLTVEFTALQFNKHQKNQYRYQLVGLNPTWVESHRVHFKLSPNVISLVHDRR